MSKKGLSMVLGPEVMSFTTVHVDDVCIGSTSFKKHMEHIKKLFERPKEYNVTIKI